MHKTKVILSYLSLFSILVFAYSYSNESAISKKGKSTSGNITEQSFFKKIIFFNIKTLKTIKIKGSELLIQDNGNELMFLKPDGFLKDDKKIFFNADTGVFHKDKNNFNLKTNAILKMKNSILKSNIINYLSDKNLITAKNKVNFTRKGPLLDGTLNIKADYLKSYIDSEDLYLSGRVRGSLKRKRLYQEGISFNSSQLKYIGKKGIGILTNNVILKRATWTASARNGKIFLNNHSKRLKYYQLNDDVKLVEKVNKKNGEESFERRAFSERLTGFVMDQKIVLFGEPKLYQQGDLIKGTKITLREDKQLIEVDNTNSDFDLRQQ